VSGECTVDCLCRICVGCDEMCDGCEQKPEDGILYCSNFQQKLFTAEAEATKERIEKKLHGSSSQTEDKVLSGEVNKCSHCAYSGQPEIDSQSNRILYRCYLQVDECIPSWEVIG
jgi:hypothetical protein